MSVQSIVAEALEQSGVSKAELARRSGISRSSLLSGKRQPSVTQLERLGESAGLRLEINWTPLPSVLHDITYIIGQSTTDAPFHPNSSRHVGISGHAIPLFFGVLTRDPCAWR